MLIVLIPYKQNLSCLLLINGVNVQLYVIGSSTKLGKWKVQDALKLSYSGESNWHADCVLPKGDFPIKYPFGFLYIYLFIIISSLLIWFSAQYHYLLL